jgi:anti-sigma factor RsiW
MEVHSQLISADARRTELSSDYSRLEDHLTACENCAEESASMIELARELRGTQSAVTATNHLVRSTQMRVRERALQLREREERLSPLWISCTIASMWALISIPFLWEGFAWLGGHGRVANVIWQSGFVVAWLMPFGLAAALLLWLRGDKAIQH